MDDIILISIDCWRSDAPSRMPALQREVTGNRWASYDAICAAHSTNYALPALLSGTYYPRAYQDSGGLKQELISLPERLSAAGYQTGGFVASNVYAAKWATRFDEWFNDGMGGSDSEMYPSTVEKWKQRISETLLMQKRVPATDLIKRAHDWYQQAEGPRFMWLHLMEPHVPYFPGLERARDAGLLKSYLATADFYRNGEEASGRTLSQIERLYWETVRRLDEQLPQLFGCIDDDATVVLTADHGEDFGHGVYNHLRPYDECVRVPLFTRNISADMGYQPRQIDIAPTLLSEQDISPPSGWDGSPAEGDHRVANILAPDPGDDLLFAASRRHDAKLIQRFEESTREYLRSEVYDLAEDPAEHHDLGNEGRVPELRSDLERFLKDDEIQKHVPANGGVSAGVQSRLEELGYVN